jgi:hypothetical protein
VGAGGFEGFHLPVEGNAVRDIAEQMKTAGVCATFSERRTGGMQELTIAYPARRRRTERYQSI